MTVTRSPIGAAILVGPGRVAGPAGQMFVASLILARARWPHRSHANSAWVAPLARV